MQFGAIIAFYASIVAIITLLFEVINFAYPPVNNYYQYYFPSISFQVATILVFFPLYLALSSLMQKHYSNEPELRNDPLRKWLAFLTLFIAGAVVAGDLVAVAYRYLDGQELTAGFLLKALVLLVIAASVFAYYLREIRNEIEGLERHAWRVFAATLVFLSIALGFIVIGSPADQRARREDMQRVSDLQGIQWQIVNYWQQKQVLPANLSDLNDSISGYKAPADPKTGEAYEYRRSGGLSFSICATFGRESLLARSTRPGFYVPEMSMRTPDVWEHKAGRTCFEKSIDPLLYPPVMKDMRF